MDRPKPTRLVSFLALALACNDCQRADPQAAPPTASTPQPSAATEPPAAKPPAHLLLDSSENAAPAPAAPTPLATASTARTTQLAGQAPTRVLVLGDSLSDEKVGGGGFVRLLRERCHGVTFDNRAKGGFMVNQMRKRLETEVLPEGVSYSHAIVFGGVNDLYSDQTAHRTLERIESDLTRIYSALRERSVQVIAITVTPWGGFRKWFSPERGQNTQTLNAWIVDEAKQGHIARALDAYPLLSCGDPERLCPELAAPHKDGLHFGQLGHQKLAQALQTLAFPACLPQN